MPIILGKNSYCHHYTESGDLNNKQTKVGNYTSINSINIIGWASFGHNVGMISNYPFGWHTPHLTDANKFKKISIDKINTYNRITSIGNDVWIGSNVSIKCGVTIGDGVIIGFNSNVTKNIPPYCVVGGNPAKIIYKRYSDEIITKLLEIKWWNWDDEKIKNNCHWFMDKTINEFVDYFINDIQQTNNDIQEITNEDN